MSTITSLHPLTDTITNPDHVNENFYSSAFQSFQHVNGYLDSDNADFDVDASQIRRQSVVGGQMRGLTGNLDYVSLIFPTDDGDAKAYTPNPGASISFYLPYDASVVIFSWLITGTNNQRFNDSDNPVCELKMFVDDSFQPHQFRALPETQEASGTTRRKQRERFWNGHHTKMSMTEGWHNASVRMFQNKNTTRIRVRNMKVIWFK